MAKTLYQKIHQVMKDVSYLSKDDKIEFGKTKYKAISEEKVTTTLRVSLIENGLVILPIEQESSRQDNITTTNTKYKIVDIETGEHEILASSGQGADTQDKGVGKSMTYSYKYLLLRTFAIPTGEDPDKVSSAELDQKQNSKSFNGALRDTGAKHNADGPPPLITNELVGKIKNEWLKLGYEANTLNAQLNKIYKSNVTELTLPEANEFLTKLKSKEKSA